MRRIGAVRVALATDDEASILLAEHQRELKRWLIVPPVPRRLPQTVANKHGIAEQAAIHRVPTPAAAFPTSFGEVVEFADRALFPVVVKSGAPFLHWTEPVVGSGTLVDARDQMLALAA